jgi:hypothetical protein
MTDITDIPSTTYVDKLRRDLVAVEIDDTGAAHRVVADTRDAPIAAAVALHTGLPFALIDQSTSGQSPRVHGELYPSESVIAVAVPARHLPAGHRSPGPRRGCHRQRSVRRRTGRRIAIPPGRSHADITEEDRR